jgi:uncharacterized UPF0160 family protein
MRWGRHEGWVDEKWVPHYRRKISSIGLVWRIILKLILGK